jgi:SAM-dependent methyltransferase
MVSTGSLTLHCSACGSDLQAFAPGPGGRPNAACPRCGSLERHRFLGLLLEMSVPMLDPIDVLLDIAPSPQTTAIFERIAPGLHCRLDLGTDNRLVDVLGSVTALPYRDDSVDLLVCSHVLEHVPDDRAAMREIARVLRPGGLGIIAVPFRAGVPTEEDPTASEAERIRRFGQADHVRYYGDDFEQRLTDAGLGWQRETPLELLGEEGVRAHGLNPDEPVWLVGALGGVVELNETVDFLSDPEFHRAFDDSFGPATNRVVVRTPAQAPLPLRAADWVELYAADFALDDHVVEADEDVRTYVRLPQRPHDLPGRLVITLTSYPARFGTLELTLRRLLHQSVTADEVVLWVAPEDEPRLPGGVRRLTRRGLTIRTTPDTRSYKKIIPALEAYPDAFLLAVDDDQVYPFDMVGPLVAAYRSNDEVLCRRAHAVSLDDAGRIRPYAQWRHELGAGHSGAEVFPTGCGGTLYPPRAFAAEVTDEAAFTALAPEADDVWLYWMMRRAGRVARVVGPTWLNETWPGSQSSSLMESNWSGGNDRQIAAMLDRFGSPLADAPVVAPAEAVVVAPAAARSAEAMPKPVAPVRLAGETFDSAEYWSERYRDGGHSGAGSYGRLAEFKAEVLNAFVARHAITTVIEFGSGDGAQLELATYPRYVGYDVAERSLQLCRERFAGDPTKAFVHTDAYAGEQAELSLSLDVIYHLVEDPVFELYMTRLFDAGERFVIVYASNVDEATTASHVRHRRFTDWVAAHRPEFTLVEHIPNRYPLVSDPAEESFADFFVFARTTADVTPSAPVPASAPAASASASVAARAWQPTKYALVDGLLQATTDPAELSPTSRLVASLTAKFYNRVIPDLAHGRLLDLGCGKAPMRGLYERYVDEVVTADWPSSLHANDHLDVTCDLTKPLPFADAEFDTVLFSDVLEHLPDPELAMAEISRILRPGGVLLLNTPFLYWIHEAPHDYYRHTRFSLERLVAGAGMSLQTLVQLGGAMETLADMIGKVLPRLHADGAVWGRALQELAWQRHEGERTLGVEEDGFPLAYGLVAVKH